MSVTVTMQKVRGALVPVDEQSEAFLARMRNGDGMAFDVRVVRNIRFHRKFMALLRLGFDAWSPEAIDGRTDVHKSFDKFREQVLIMAGHYDAVYQLDGTFVLDARSISFAKLDEHSFNDLYDRMLDVMWEKVLQWARYADKRDVEETVNRLVAFS